MSRLAEIASRAQQAIASGDIDQAVSYYRTACQDRAHPESSKIRADYGLLLWQIYELDQASGLFSELIQDASCEVSVLQQIARCYFGVGRYGLAADVMQAAVSRLDSDSDLLAQWASCLERSNRLEEAAEVAEKALQNRAENRAAVRLLAHIERRNGNTATAIERLAKHLKLYPDGETWVLKYELAACLDRDGLYALAWSNLIEAKAQLSKLSRSDLANSYSIRQRQGEFSKRITDVDLARWHQTSVESPMRLAFLAGFPRSGTTLLESILTAHPSVLGTDETGILSKQFIQPLVWQAKDVFDALLEVRSLDNEQIQAGRKTYLQFTSAVIESSMDGRLLIEKDPLLTSDLPVPLRLFPESQIILPLRDPRDVIISYFFTMVPFQWNSSPATNIVESARFYHDVMRHWLLFRGRLAWPWIETRYEALVVRPMDEVRRLSDFLGLDFQQTMLDTKNRATHRMISTPTYDDVTKPIHANAIGRWKNYRQQLEPALPILETWVQEFQYG